MDNSKKKRIFLRFYVSLINLYSEGGIRKPHASASLQFRTSLGHMTAIEAPDRTSAELLDFLETVSQTGKANR